MEFVHQLHPSGRSIRFVYQVRPSIASIKSVHPVYPSGVSIWGGHQVRRLDTFISCIYGVRPSGEKFTLNITIICTFGLKNKLNNQRKWGFKHAAHPFCPNTIPKIPSFTKQIAGYTRFFGEIRK